MSNYKEGQQVNTPQGEGRVTTDQVNDQVYVSLNGSDNVEAFNESEIEATTISDIPGEASLPPAEAQSFDFDNFLDEEKQAGEE